MSAAIWFSDPDLIDRLRKAATHQATVGPGDRPATTAVDRDDLRDVVERVEMLTGWLERLTARHNDVTVNGNVPIAKSVLKLARRECGLDEAS